MSVRLGAATRYGRLQRQLCRVLNRKVKDSHLVKIIPFRSKQVTPSFPAPPPLMTFETLCTLIKELRDDIRAQMLMQKEMRTDIRRVLALLRSRDESGRQRAEGRHFKV